MANHLTRQVYLQQLTTIVNLLCKYKTVPENSAVGSCRCTIGYVTRGLLGDGHWTSASRLVWTILDTPSSRLWAWLLEMRSRTMYVAN